MNTAKIRRLPDASGTDLSRWDKAVLFVKMNRGPIGFVLFILSFVFRVSLTMIPGHSQYADYLKEAGIALMGGSLALFFAGTSKSDGFQERKAIAVVREASGEYPIFKDRAGDPK